MPTHHLDVQEPDGSWSVHQISAPSWQAAFERADVDLKSTDRLAAPEREGRMMRAAYRLTQVVLFATVALILSIMAAAFTIPPMSETDFLAIAVALG